MTTEGSNKAQSAVSQVRILDVERKVKPKWTGSLAIVLVARDRCLRCAGNVIEFVYGQLPLFRSHGHGAVQQTRLMLCTTCDWNFVSDVTEVNPRRAKAPAEAGAS